MSYTYNFLAPKTAEHVWKRPLYVAEGSRSHRRDNPTASQLRLLPAFLPVAEETLR